MKNLETLLYQELKTSEKMNWEKVKRVWAKKTKKIIKNSEILSAYESLVAQGRIARNEAIEKSLKVRKVRTLSGVAPFAVMMKPFACPGKCIYCPLEKGMPKSYMSDEPAAARAKDLSFDPKKQVLIRISQMEKTGHKPEKLQIIVIGGTFSAYPFDYKLHFIKAIFDSCNGRMSKTIEAAQKLNETAKYRIIGLSIETRPDWISEEEIKLLRKLGVTKVQLGVQALDNAILKKIKRGHTLKEVALATKILRDNGFKINYHFMPNLPGSTPKKDIQMAKIMFDDDRFKPDTLKIYPCIVVPNSPLYEIWKQGKYRSYTDETLINTLASIKEEIPYYCRIDRLVRDITKQWTASGTNKTNMRQLVKEYMNKQGKRCQCIRCREVRDRSDNTNDIPLTVNKYSANDGKELFLAYEDKNYLYGMLRLRFPSKINNYALFSTLKNAALIRELQIFGQQATLEHTQKTQTQHKSLGRQLVAQAEKLAKEAGFEKLAIISGVGVRGYYRKLGYELEETYMVKNL